MHRTTRNRLIAGASAAVAVALALTGCTGSGNTGGNSDEKVSIDYWGWVPGLDKAIAAWNAENPDIQVTFSNTPADTAPAKLQAAVKAGNAPCLAQVGYSDLLSDLVDGQLLDVTEQAAQYKKDYVDFAWSLVSPGGKTYGIPQDTGPMVMYYRTDLFEQYGITVPKTWDEYAAAAKKVQAANPDVAIGALAPNDAGAFEGYAWQAGAKWFSVDGDQWKVSIDDKATQKVASYWQGLVDSKAVPVKLNYTPEYYADLASGKLLTVISAAWYSGIISQNAADTSGKWAIAPMPSWDASKPASANLGGSASAVFQGCKYPEQALKFANWLNSSETSMNILADPKGGGLYPAATAALGFDIVNAKSAFFGNQVPGEQFASASKAVPEGWNFGPISGQTIQNVQDALTNVQNGTGTIPAQLSGIQSTNLDALKSKGINASAG